ncbi:unnamed protein product [Microthlaspi erraticum]|uniref:DUF4283 domain-containing protein n=1 Tax=Microthlaspi erraticum TaxID=1685480 RepID=A0A6D2HRL8_9BRAS|nr:unnamed protein product [Microthlaspi erraticum]
MARRFTYAEKGKSVAPAGAPNPQLRIRAPNVDTADLVRKNALTLIGRLTNPQEQRMRTMLPYFSNKWELRGAAEGSDLGNGCFQFRLDYAEDLRKVLEDRPYQYSRWMVILEKWEPIILPTFPSQIPFWISLRGIPLHYWKRELLLSIGEKLGHLTSYELTSTAAKIKVEVNRLASLTKEAIVEFEGGSEALVTLEYHKLDKHCLYCLMLTHEESECPENPKAKTLPRRESSPTVKPNHLKPPFFTTSGEPHLPHQRDTGAYRTKALSQRPHGSRASRSPPHSRVSKGARGSPDLRASRQTNSSPPYRVDHRIIPRQRYSVERSQPWSRSSPQQRQRDPHNSPRRRSTQIWREKSPRCEILQDLQDVDIRYVNCGDPAESAARRQRILESDNNGLLADTVAFLYNAPSNLIPLATEVNPTPPEVACPLENDANRRADPIESPEQGLVLAKPTKRRGRPPSKLANPSSSNHPAEGTSKRKTKNQLRSPLLRISPLSRVIQSRSNATPQNLPARRRRTDSGQGQSSLPPRARTVPAKLKDGADFQSPPSPLP